MKALLIILLVIMTGCSSTTVMSQLSNLQPPVKVAGISRSGDVMLIDRTNTILTIQGMDSTAKAINGNYRTGDILIPELKEN